MNKKISVITPSYLGEYENCASDRENKFIRAVNSFIANTYENKELVIIGDSCDITERLLTENFSKEIEQKQIIYHRFEKKQKLFSGKLRTKGIELATGDIITYLDTDDFIGVFHLKAITDQIYTEDLDWCYFNNFMNTDGGLMKKETELEHTFIGTSCIAHLKHPNIDWRRCNGYGHDWKFIKRLIKWSSNYYKAFGCMYVVCHVPKQFDR